MPAPTAVPPPADRVAALVAWFDRSGRPWLWRESRDRWVVHVAEVCLQQTQVARAAPFVERILERFPTPEVMATAPLGELLELWQGLGFPRRARNLWLASQQITAHGWPDRYEELPGVGAYTADAIRCFADGAAVLPEDINTRRVMRRLFPDGPPPVDDHWTWGQAVMELGQRACRARARCEECPLTALCPSAGTTEIIASAPQKPYAGSMRERRGVLLKALTTDGEVPVDRDPDAARSLAADGLAHLSDDLLLPPLG